MVSKDRVIHIPRNFNISDNWEWRQLDDVCEGIFDCPHSTPEYTTEGPLVVRSQDMRSGVLDVNAAARVSEETYIERNKRAEPRFGDLLYSREGTYFGIAAEVPEDTRLCLGQRMVLIRPKANVVNFRYLRYWLNSPALASHIHGQRDGTVAERLNLPTIRRLPIPIAPMSTQEDIAKILGDLDDKIELNRQINQTLYQIAQAIFKSWFVDFEPVKAKIEAKQNGQDPQRAAIRAISGKTDEELDQLSSDQLEKLATTAALFPDKLEDSVLGEIPRGWNVGVVSDFIEFNPKRVLKKGIVAPYLDMKNMPTEGHLAQDVYPREFGSGTKFTNGDALLARITPCLENGKTAFVDFLKDGEVGWGSTEYIVMRSKDNYPECFAYFMARHESFRQFAIQRMMGTSGRQRASADALMNMPWVVPEKALAIEFGKYALLFMKQIKSNGDSGKTLAMIRDSLLPKLLSGEITLDDTQPKEEAVA